MTSVDSLRWNDYVLGSTTAESRELLLEATKDRRRTLLVCGAGFDPRTTDAAQEISTLDLADLQVIAIKPGPAGDHSGAQSSAAENLSQLKTLFGDRLTVVDSPEVEEVAAAGTVLTRFLVATHGILDYDTVIVDMSGLPSAISFTVLHLFLQGADGKSRNLVVTVSDDPQTDARIRAAGLGDAGVLNALTRIPTETDKRVIWIPVLGSGAGDELQSLRTMLDPQEVCPVVPFPARAARLGDDLLVEHRTFLFEEVKFEPRNVMYASENNPFDLYRQVVSLSHRYRAALEPLGEVAIVVSEHASKLLSLGVLLAAHEAHLSVAQVLPLSYTLSDDDGTQRDATLHTAWLIGEPYDVGSSEENGHSGLLR
jgi:hypothetical protein